MTTIYAVAISAFNMVTSRPSVVAVALQWTPSATENEAQFQRYLDALAQHHYPAADGWSHHLVSIAAVTPEMLAQVQA